MDGIRLARPGDGKTLRKLVSMVLTDDNEVIGTLDNLSQQVDEGGYPDLGKAVLQRRATGTAKEFGVLTTLRMYEADGRPVGMSYSAPPMDWVAKRSGLKINMIGRLSERFTELEMLAVLPEYRKREYGRALVEDAAQRYMKAGYAAMMVVVDEKQADRLIPWYAKSGFVFAPQGTPFIMRYWAGRDVAAPYVDILEGQTLGMLPLAGHVTIDRGSPFRGYQPVISGLLD